MATSESTIEFLREQLTAAGTIRIKKMFGEYGVYCDEKFAAVVCDNEFFVKITPAGQELTPDSEHRPPYQGAKPWIHVPGEMWDDSAWLSLLVRVTAESLTLPVKKAPRKKRQG